MPTELDKLTALEAAQEAVQICLPSIDYLPGAKTISEIAGADLNVCVQPLAGRSRLLDFLRVHEIPYMDGGPAEGDIYVVCLCLDKRSGLSPWVMWSQHRRSADQSYFHDFTPLESDQLAQLLEVSGGRESTLLFTILKKLNGAIKESKKRALKRYDASVVQVRDMQELLEESDWHPTHF